jgi:ATP-dependent helicase/nuclease subunit A
MSRPERIVPDETVRRQAIASDPARSAWVSANAGSGKTHVLAQRVIRLLLAGTDPSRILCLTYTRAAAANMSDRVFGILSSWTMLPDEALGERIQAIEGRAPGRRVLDQARRLFARALETPGGLKIQTLHAFCESVLQQFPLEANIAGHFELLDPMMEEALFAAARRELLTGAMGADAPDLREAFAAVLDRAGEHGLDALLEAIVRERDRLRAFIDAVAVDDPPYATLFEAFDFTPGDTAAGIAAQAWPLPGFTPAYFAAYAAAVEETGAANPQKFILPAARLGFAEADPVRRLDHLCEGLLKGNGGAYGGNSLGTKAVRARLPDLDDRYAEATTALIAARDRLTLFRLVSSTRSAATIADWLIGRYEQLKTGRGYLDFNDLITRTVRLLSRQDAGPWVLYKLDKGIDHILLDEAQDTSPGQWHVVRRLAEEFFAGVGARPGEMRTVFAVGDEKQSIYSFQGAAPDAFAESRHLFSARVRDAELQFEDVRLTLSFRSTPDVLAAVDRVFAEPEVRRGLSADDQPIAHNAIREGVAGHVELWPSLGPGTVEEPDDWTVAVDHARAPAVRLAENIARTIDRWLTSGEAVGDDRRPLTAGDVLVLVRKRSAFVHALSRSLKERHIAVAGADRLNLADHIAVRDMIALGRFLLQPRDDLSLAALLKSPVFGFDEEALYRLAIDRGRGVPLRSALRAAAGTDARCRIVAETLDRWANEAAYRRPFEFYAGVLGRDGIRARMVGRLGRDAGDILDEFLTFALAQERTGLPGLEMFLATLDQAAPEIKREMDQSRDEVRIMTVHAAKGLEAPVVFLVDGGAQPFSHTHQPVLLPFRPKGAHAAAPFWYLWRASGDLKCETSKALETAIAERADDEYRRLLYVGMTRAEDRLVVCGLHGKKQPQPTTWHSIVTRALSAAPEAREQVDPVVGPVVRFAVTRSDDTPAVASASRSAAPAEAVIFPEDLRRELPPVPEPPRPLAPSGASALWIETEAQPVDGRSPVLDTASDPGFAVRRGIALHRLLQALPDIEPDGRTAAASRYLDRVADDWPDGERERALSAVLAVLDAPDHAGLFAPGSRAEVSVMGKVEVRGVLRAVAGKIDRIAVGETEVLIVDYKTGLPGPSGSEAVPMAYVAQLALYRALLLPLYPGRAVRAALLYTEVPRLVPLADHRLDAALARLTEA